MNLSTPNRLSLVAVGAGLLLAGCAYDNTEDLLGNTPPTPACNPAASTYAAVIAPLLQQNCVPCHNNSINGGGVLLETYEQVRAVALARNAQQLVGVVSYTPGFQPMPQNRKLSDCEIDHIRRWVAAGALRD